MIPRNHPLDKRDYIDAEDLRDQVLLTYSVAIDRLDIYSQLLNPAGVVPKQHITSETTDIMLQRQPTDAVISLLNVLQ